MGLKVNLLGWEKDG